MNANQKKRSNQILTDIGCGASAVSTSLRQFFNSPSPKTPLALWGLRQLVSDRTAKNVSSLLGHDLKSGVGLVSDQVESEIKALAEPLEAGDNEPGLDGTILTLGAAQALALATVSDLKPYLAGQMKAVSDWARSNDAIENLLVKSLGIEIGLWVACAAGNLNAANVGELADEFEAAVAENLDADGWPDSRLLRQIEGFAGCWARIFQLLKAGDVDITGNVQIQLEWFARQCMRLRLKDATMIFGQARPDSIDESFWTAITAMSSDPDDAVIADMVNRSTRRNEDDLANQSKRTKLKPSMANQLVDPHNLSEWAEAFLLRSDWRGKSPRVAVSYSKPESSADESLDQQQCFTEIARSMKLVSGPTLPEIQVAGELAKFEGAFEVICEVHDEDLDYVEMQIELSTGGRLNRQWILSRKDEFLVVTDSVLSSSSSEIDYRCTWPLAESVTTMAETETTEVYLQDESSKTIQALVLPLGLPEWKADRFDGGLLANSDAVVLEQKATGKALFAALVFDLKPARSRKKRTWRQLTVAENREPVKSDQAVAFRFQLNNRQWFFYRALASTGNRTFLGQNVVSEFSFYRLRSSGAVHSLVEVE